MKDHPTARSGSQWRGSSQPNAAHSAASPSSAQQQGEPAHGGLGHEVRQGLAGELALSDKPARRRAGEPRATDGSISAGDEHDDGGVRPGGDLLRHGEAIQVGQLDVHQDDVRANGPDLSGGLGPVTSLAHDRESPRL